jgi:DNA polymerase-3 subunit alpha
MNYTPLHVHTSKNSIGDSILKLNEYIDKAKRLDLKSLCVTGHGSLADMYDFYFKCLENNIKPIIGCEIYLTPDMEDKTKDSETYHMILIAKDNEGLKNLINIVSIASLDGFYRKPRIDLNYIKEHNEGIICLTACVAGMLPQLILDNKEDEIKEHIEELKDIFDEDLYFEIQPGNFVDQIQVNNKLIELSNQYNVPLVVTNDVHYLNADDYKIHDYHVRLGRKMTISDDLIYPDTCYYLMGYDELKDSLSMYDEDTILKAIENTNEIADKCHVTVEIKDLNLPEFECPTGYNPRTYIEHLCYKRLDKIKYLIKDPSQYIDRMHYELDTLEELGFTSYMLIMWDIYRYAREENIMMGPGRGSVSGSVVAYLLQLVTIDPLKYNLLFERFTSIHRKGSIPDIDMDCPSEYREQMFKYVIDKYGLDHCAAVSTFTMRKAKSAIRDVCRLLEIDLKTADKIAKLIPTVYYLDDDSEEDKLVDLSIEEALEHVPELKEYQNIYPELFDIAMKLEGLESAASIHAAGTLITREPVLETMPMIRQQKKELQATALELKACELVKGIKYDFLGLNTLDILIYCQQLCGDIFDMEFDPCDDPDVWDLISSNKTTGLFQIGTDTYKKRMPRLAPKTISELAACLALVRGPCISAGTDEVYMRIQEGLDDIHLIHPYYDDATKETNGALIFQEQLMQVCINMGMSIEDAFKTMKFAAKKKFDKLKEAKDKLYNNVQGTISDDAFEQIFKIIVDAGKYLFNQSHAVAYAMVGYTTAYYKCHYPKEFIASTLSYAYINGGDVNKRRDKLNEIYKDARREGIKFLPPDITKSSWKFTIEDDAIRVGLCAISSFSDIAYEEIKTKCTEWNEEESLLEQILNKVEKRKCGKRAMIPLILSGALGDRVENYNKFGEIRKEEPQSELYIHNSLTIDLYSSDTDVEIALLEVPYVSNPVNEFVSVGLDKLKNNKSASLKAFITKVKSHKTKTKETMAFLTFDTGDGEIEVVAFSDAYKAYKKQIKKGNIIDVTIKKTNKGYQLLRVTE